ncbi:MULTISPECIES: IpaD/SipD/SspD family type III secretion system needle tip protein [unclassified Herbaspirillum]|uniref:IpaD/SipD/SspD family type III secretion system needle tip protein n=1 Tax=unclassified Herbaspirillum TaxID=2624150 RepID=UPI001154F378|nr:MULTISPECIES: IpaD/SipD/SspD family type III secretion system needle tip protein [unclassified Herbaspirillum]MBB5390582.1 type III secretion system IpaD/SipD/SspD family effector [Herbaspirillum sp. SJZ102]TQK08930.1 type III secretion system IpaD/SipD/SspD family effector [Herbaspirillum sp. SJZ130]TQK14383.1 type III secretion system IpaD/SipD/SspD family effector [Herbaspirillum sp. SJZ106]
MEITQHAQRYISPTKNDAVDPDSVGQEKIEAGESLASGADGTRAASYKTLLGAALAMQAAFEKPGHARTKVHEAIQSALKRGPAGGIDQRKLPALREALADAMLSDKLDLPRTKAAVQRFAGLMQNDGAGDSNERLQSFGASAGPGQAGTGNSLNEIWKQLSDAISQWENGNQDKYAAALDQYTKMYQGISDILGKFGQWVHSDNENYMKVDFGDIKKALEGLLKKYDPPSQSQLIAGKAPRGGLTQDEAKAVCKLLGLDEGQCCYKNSADGTYCVIPDLSQVRKMRDGLPAQENGHRISIASYNAWKAGFDSQMSRVEDSLQARGQKENNDYGNFQNFQKTIVELIKSMTDMLRQFLQF